MERKNSFHENGVPIQPLEVGLQAARSAVVLVFSLVLPQTALVFNYEPGVNDEACEEAALDQNKMKMEKRQALMMKIEKFIMNLNYVVSIKHASQIAIFVINVM